SLELQNKRPAARSRPVHADFDVSGHFSDLFYVAASRPAKSPRVRAVFRRLRPLRQRQSLLEQAALQAGPQKMSTELRPQPRPGVMDIAAYVPGKSHAPAGVARVHKLSSNENPLGPSPRAIEAAQAVAGKLALYPDGSSKRLREAIASAHGLNVANIMAFNGSDEALALLTRIYVGEGDEGVYSQYGFLAYPIYIRAVGATPVIAPETDERADVDT